MPRTEKPIDPTRGPVAEFAARLRELRHAAGTPAYRALAARTNYSITVLSQAAAGVVVPPWPVVKAFVIACKGDPLEWEPHWLKMRSDQAAHDAAMAQPLLGEPENPEVFRVVRANTKRHIADAAKAPAPACLKVFLLDDHELLRHGVRSLLENEPDMTVIGEAATVAEAKSQIPVLKPDVAILDIRLPDGNGIEVCRYARTGLTPPPACLMLTSYADDNALYRAIFAGAAGYLLKGEPAAELIKAVRMVGSGDTLLDYGMAMRKMGLDLRSDPIAGLTYREQDVLSLLTDGMASWQIARRLHIRTSTVDQHVGSILRKLDVRSRTQAAVLAVARQAKPILG